MDARKCSFSSGNRPHLFSTLAETRSRRRRESRRRYSRVVGRQQEVQQQADGLLGADLVGGGHALVQLAKDGGQHHLEARHGELAAEVHGVDGVLPERLDDVPNVDQMHCRPKRV